MAVAIVEMWLWLFPFEEISKNFIATFVPMWLWQVANVAAALAERGQGLACHIATCHVVWLWQCKL